MYPSHKCLQVVLAILCGIPGFEAFGWDGSAGAGPTYSPSSSLPRSWWAPWAAPANPYNRLRPSVEPERRTQAGFDGEPHAAGLPSYDPSFGQPGYGVYGGYRFRPLTAEERGRQSMGPAAAATVPVYAPHLRDGWGRGGSRVQSALPPYQASWGRTAYGFRPRVPDNSRGVPPESPSDGSDDTPVIPEDQVHPASTDLWILPAR